MPPDEDMKDIKILALVIGGSRRHASTRYRVMQYTDKLKLDGIQVEILHAKPKSTSGIQKLINQINEEQCILKKAEKCDITIIQKRLFRSGFVNKLLKTGTKIIFDMDDSLVSGAGQNKKWTAYTEWRLKKRLNAILSSADIVFAGSTYLAQQAQKHTDRITTIPTSVDTGKYKPSNQKNRFNLVYIGQTRLGTYPDLAPIYPVIQRLTQKHPEIKLHIISSAPIHIDGVNIIFHEWSEEAEAMLLADCSIGISPMQDNDFTRGRCGLKLLQYMAAGLPVICSPVGANTEIVRNGHDGYYASTIDQWYSLIDKLISDDELRIKIGKQGRERVINQYSLDIVYDQIKNSITSLIHRR